MNSLFPISSPSVIYRELAACAPILEKFGMALSPAETAALAEQQSAAPRSSGRIDLSGGAVKQLALIFCDSPYILRADWPDMLAQLLSLFYALKMKPLTTSGIRRSLTPCTYVFTVSAAIWTHWQARRRNGSDTPPKEGIWMSCELSFSITLSAEDTLRAQEALWRIVRRQAMLYAPESSSLPIETVTALMKSVLLTLNAAQTRPFCWPRT